MKNFLKKIFERKNIFCLVLRSAYYKDAKLSLENLHIFLYESLTQDSN